MSDDEERVRVDRIERAVLARIERRGAIGRGLARAAVAVVLVGALAGGVVALQARAGSSSSTAAGSAVGDASAPTADSRVDTAARPAPRVDVRCHATSAADSAVVTVRTAGGALSTVASDCAAAFGRATVPVVLCVSGSIVSAYPADRDPATLCRRDGEQPEG